MCSVASSSPASTRRGRHLVGVHEPSGGSTRPPPSPLYQTKHQKEDDYSSLSSKKILTSSTRTRCGRKGKTRGTCSRSDTKQRALFAFVAFLLLLFGVVSNDEMLSSSSFSSSRSQWHYFTQAFQQQCPIDRHRRGPAKTILTRRMREFSPTAMCASSSLRIPEPSRRFGLNNVIIHERFNQCHHPVGVFNICTMRHLTKGSGSRLNSRINNNSFNDHHHNDEESHSSSYVAIPEVSAVDDDFGVIDGFHFEVELPLPPLHDEDIFDDMLPLSLPSSSTSFDRDAAASNLGIDPPIPRLFDNDYDQQYIDDMAFSEQRRHQLQSQASVPTQESSKIQERRIQQLEMKRRVLIQDLNPSQIDAVTQPVPKQSPTHKLQQTSTTISPTPQMTRSTQQGWVAPVPTSSGDAVITRVIAGPGSGKTRVLTCRIIHLLQEDPNQGRVLAVTFTRKAAGEMKERVERMLQELEELEDDSNNYSTESDDILRLDRYGDVIVREETYGRSTRNNEDVKPQPRELERVELGTFHSVCAKIMRYNGNLLIDLPSVRRDMSMAAPVEVSPQEAAADGKNLPALVDAQANLNAQFAIVDQAEQIRIVKECLKEQEIDLKTLDVKPIEIISGISDIREKFAQNEDPFEDKNTRKPGMGRKQRLARKIYYPYREKLLANNAVDFDDLIFMTRELLMDNPDLRQRLHCRWPHVLVDEFQDTSRTQMDLVKLLTSSSLFVVGDADQSIYSWRGAHVRSLHDVKTEFESYGEVSTVYLKENYRSTSNIVKAAEKVISAGQWKKPSVSIDEDDSVASLDSDEWSSDEVRRSMKPKRGAGPSPRVIACADERAEATFVVETILNMTSKEELKPDSTVAIIYRTNAQSRYLEEACVDKNLPYVIRGGAGGFYKRAEIKDSLCFLRWLFNGDDESSMLRAFKTPSKGIGDKAIEEFRAYVGKVQEYYRRSRPLNQRPTPLDILTSMASNQSSPDGFTLLVDGAPEPTEYISKRALTKFIEFGQKMGDIRTNALTMTVDKLLFYIIDELKLIEHFDSISKTKTEFADRQENVQELRQAAKKYATYGPALMSRNAASVKLTDDPFMDESESALGIFLDDVALVSDAAETESEGDGSKGRERMIVNLMTIHASKGTEFDAVFVVGLEEGTLPCSPSLQEGESQQLEEERRLCYVAMTRAKTNLVLTWRKEVTSFSSWSDSGPKTSRKKRSRFLDALVSNKSKLTGDDSKKTFKTKSGEKKEAIGTNDLLRPKGRDARNGVRQRQTREQVQLKSPHDFSTATKPPAAKRKQSSLSHSKQLSSPYYKSSQSKTGAVNGGKSKPSTTTSAAVASPKTLILSTSSSPKTAAASVPAEAAHHLLDPSWFFPVGQPVIHRQFGKGIVMGHPPCNDIDDATVSVQFMNGRTMEFPALGTDILPDM